eukprot:2679455-Amphidinium_carterae.1
MELGPNGLHIPCLAVDAQDLLGIVRCCVDAIADCDRRCVLAISMELGPDLLHIACLAVDAQYVLGAVWCCVHAVASCDCRTVLGISIEMAPNAMCCTSPVLQLMRSTCLA